MTARWRSWGRVFAVLLGLAWCGLASLAAAPLKRVALVFDDGPRPEDAGPLLALLAKEKVAATFSLVGDSVQENPAEARAIAAQDCEIVNHSQTHSHPGALNDAALDREIIGAQKLLTSTLGSAPRWYWPPFLEADDRVRATAARAGLSVYVPRHLVVSQDYDRAVTAAEIYRRATTDVRDGSVILFHEWRAETRAQLPAIIAELRRQGCGFFTFSGLAAALTAGPVARSSTTAAKRFSLVERGVATPLVVAEGDWAGVRRAAGDLRTDIGRATGKTPVLTTTLPAAKTVVLAGTVGRSALIDELVAHGKLDVSGIRGRWEAFQIEVVDRPLPGVERALVIAGSDKRGTIYGLYEISRRIGVSPWAWWADVPVAQQDEIFLSAERIVEPGPTVKYRGIFLNDEAPALTGWAKEKFGGLNHAFYAHVFELLLRLRANYLWPAMWNNAFNEDDPDNARLADEYGIVMGTSHHEPMLRAQQEWKRHGHGAWNYATNGETLRKFWSDGLRRNRDFESIITIGMRGDGDEAMTEGTNVALLEQIVADQRKIIRDTMGRPPAEVPQLWALYKEVQAYYEHGMRVPDDVTLLWCDDNWGNLRRLPTAAERTRRGGAGVYYHFDYVGDPRNYKWLNTIPLTKIWEQMHLAWRYGADRIWIVNVGDLKPMEFPIEFFLTYAWRPEAIGYHQLGDYARAWAARQFGATAADEVADLINGYTKLNGRRKPEMLAPDTFSLVNYDEAERVLAEWRGLEARARALSKELPAEARAAFFQLVQQPIEACRIVNELVITAGRNRLHAVQGRASTNAEAARARALFAEDAALTAQWDAMLDGKWRHMMDQTHLGYTSWQQPIRNAMPAVTELQVPERGELGVAVEGDPAARPGDYPIPAEAKLPPLSPWGPAWRWIDVFNRGHAPVHFSIEANAPWLKVSVTKGDLGPDVRVAVSVDWSALKPGVQEATLTVRGDGGEPPIVVKVPIDCRPVTGHGFVELDGHVAIEAPNFSRAQGANGATWKVLPDFGRMLGGVTTWPVTASADELGKGARLDYDVFFRSTGEFVVELQCAPTFDFQPGQPREFAVSLDDQPPAPVKLGLTATDHEWEQAVGDGVKRVTARIQVDRPGEHVLKIWRMTAGVVIERILIDTGGMRRSYLGPVESGRGRP
ncbi:glycosyl hydrolase 115 family protein [Horticoccus luteus]|uniref:Glycosyl hydrolase 115 family protein n=1 Tax=Horticoccus luteus TaxID=2862869 RepID=A0A8F9TR27_9BACT|nr:glycosyl hydrolase 115 family protein [Horticoccus luteus]QYM77624.1 glycosyl hydrolase 115 family protein [Horticoccus luteus]